MRLLLLVVLVCAALVAGRRTKKPSLWDRGVASLKARGRRWRNKWRNTKVKMMQDIARWSRKWAMMKESVKSDFKAGLEKVKKTKLWKLFVSWFDMLVIRMDNMKRHLNGKIRFLLNLFFFFSNLLGLV
jgi:hypothetical protein